MQHDRRLSVLRSSVYKAQTITNSGNSPILPSFCLKAGGEERGQISTFDILSFQQDRRAFQNIGSACSDLGGKVRPTKIICDLFFARVRRGFSEIAGCF